MTVTVAKGEGTILSVGGKIVGPAGITISLRGKRLVARIVAGKETAELPLGPVTVGKAAHVALVVGGGRVAGFMDGKEVGAASFAGELAAWEGRAIVVGGEGWSGRVEGVAVYARAMSPATVAQHAAAYAAIRAARPVIPQAAARARLVAKSVFPTLKQIAPYRQALVVYEYEVIEWLRGRGEGRIAVAHWAILDAEAQADVRDAPIGSQRLLVIEPIDRNAQLRAAPRFDSLQPMRLGALWYECGM